MMNRQVMSFVGAAMVLACSTAGAQDNLVVNGGFDEDFAGWTPGPAAFQWVATDRNGAPDSGSVEFTTNLRPNNQGLSQCFPTESGTQIEVGAWAFLPEDAPTEARAIVRAVEYESEDCSDGALLFRFSNDAATPGEWTLQDLTFTTRYGTRSVALGLAPFTNTEGVTVTALYDDAYYRESAFGQFVLNPSVSASWYDPAQSGHGVMIHMLDRFSVWVCWYTFDGDGDPAWICGLGRASVPTPTLRIEEAFVMEGGAFPPDFDPDAVELVPWGQIDIEFSSCTEGTLRWTTDAPGYTNGEMPLRRLTSLWDNPCD